MLFIFMTGREQAMDCCGNHQPVWRKK